MATVYEDITTLIPNTTMQLRSVDGVPKNYTITPVEGYVLHDKNGDSTLRDEETGLPYTFMRYGRGTKSCGYNYDFTSFEMQAEGMTVTAYGNREFFALPESAAPENSTYGEVTPETEVM